MTLWSKNSALVASAGHLVDCVTCPCTGTGTGTIYSPFACAYCLNGLVPLELEIDWPDVTPNNVCGSCATYAAGTYVIPSYDGCGWRENWSNLVGSDPCNFGYIDIRFINFGGTLRLNVLGGIGGPASWISSSLGALPGATVNCMTLNMTLTIQLSTGPCTAIGKSVTVRAR